MHEANSSRDSAQREKEKGVPVIENSFLVIAKKGYCCLAWQLLYAVH